MSQRDYGLVETGRKNMIISRREYASNALSLRDISYMGELFSTKPLFLRNIYGRLSKIEKLTPMLTPCSVQPNFYLILITKQPQ